jgi:hypothetical protein
MAINDFLDSAVAAVKQSDLFHESLGARLSFVKKEKFPNSDEFIISKVSKASLNERIAGVDSGFVQKKLSFIDLLMVRAVGTIFDYKNSLLRQAQYYPRAFSFPEPILLQSGLENDEMEQSVSLERLKKEVQTSIDIIEKYSPKYLFIDGSIIPQYQDRPRKESKINEEYYSIIDYFQKLYLVAEKKECILVACVEDSRGSRFKQILEDEIIPKISKNKISLGFTFDSCFLDYFLEQGERTFAFLYTNNVENHAILKDYSKEWSKNIYVFYIKPSKFDIPLRVEFICKNNIKECADKIASIVYSLSSLHKEYSYPSVLIEADMRAGLKPDEVSMIYDKLIDRLGTKVRMRRNSRPFK